MFSQNDFAHLKFLEGNWRGSNPDGTFFFEKYDFPSSATMRSLRLSDGTFQTSTDSSTVALQDGKIISRWGKYTWRATAISAGLVAFAPVNAPSSFSWRRVDANRVDVTQRWKDESGKEQSFVVPLQRLGH